MPILYKTVIVAVAPQLLMRVSLSSPEFTTEAEAITFGTTLAQAGLAVGWRVCWRQAPDYDEIIRDLGGRWYYGKPVSYLSEANGQLPVFAVPKPAHEAPDTLSELPEGWTEDWRPVLDSPPDQVLLVSACEGTLTTQTLAKTREILVEDETVPEDALAFEVVDAFFEDCSADNQSVWVAGPDGLVKIN